MEKHVISAVLVQFSLNLRFMLDLNSDPFTSIAVALNLTKNILSYHIPFMILLKQYM